MGAVTAPSTAHVAQAARRQPSRHICRQARARGNPHGAREAADSGNIGVQASGAVQKSTAAVTNTPSGSHRSAGAQKPHRLMPLLLSMSHLTRIP